MNVQFPILLTHRNIDNVDREERGSVMFATIVPLPIETTLISLDERAFIAGLVAACALGFAVLAELALAHVRRTRRPLRAVERRAPLLRRAA